MSGALSTFARGRRRRFEAGGSAYTQGYDKLPPPEDDANTSDNSADPAGPSGGDTPMSTYSSGALAAGAPMTTDQTLDAHQTAANNLMQRLPDYTTAIMGGAGIHTPGYLDPNLDPSQREGASNLPMLAAAGAMLQPTHSGTFSEALGRAFSAAVPVAEQDRAAYETAMLRKAQMDQTAEYQKAMVGVRNKTADASMMRAAAYKAFSEAKATLMAQGLDERTANDQAMMMWRNGTLDARIAQWATVDAQGDRRLDQGDVRLGQGAGRLQLGQDRLEFDKAKLAQSDEFKNLQMQMQTLFHNDTRARLAAQSVLTYAASTGYSIERAKQYAAQQFPELLGATPVEAPQSAKPASGAAATAPAMSQAEIQQSLASAKAALDRLKAQHPADEKDQRAAILKSLTDAKIPTDGL